MKLHRSIVLMLSLVGLAGLSACESDVLQPDLEPQLAKEGRGKPDKGDKGGTPANLEEYWVYSEGGVDYVHMAVSGDVDRIAKGVIYDYFFNGLWDDDPPVDQHYEYYVRGAPTPPAEVVGDVIHTDLPFLGERWVSDDITYKFVDSPVTNVDGLGADPFAFRVGAYKGDTKRGGWTPFGVIYGGITLGAEESNLTGAGHILPHATARSYATWKGEAPVGDVWVESITLTSEPRCTVRQVSEGRGKNRTTHTATFVSADVEVVFGKSASVEALPDLWWEGHFYDVDTGVLSSRASLSGLRDTFTFSTSREMPEGWTGGNVSFVVDYVFPTQGVESDEVYYESRYAYNPALNNTTWTVAGPLGATWANGANNAVNHNLYPIAGGVSVSVTCN